MCKLTHISRKKIHQSLSAHFVLHQSPLVNSVRASVQVHSWHCCNSSAFTGGKIDSSFPAGCRPPLSWVILKLRPSPPSLSKLMGCVKSPHHQHCQCHTLSHLYHPLPVLRWFREVQVIREEFRSGQPVIIARLLPIWHATYVEQ